MSAARTLDQFLANEEHGRFLRSFEGPILLATVEIGPLQDKPDWSSLDHAIDTLNRAIRAANAAGLEGKTISKVCVTGCTRFGNLTLGWDFKTDAPPEVAA